MAKKVINQELDSAHEVLFRFPARESIRLTLKLVLLAGGLSILGAWYSDSRLTLAEDSLLLLGLTVVIVPIAVLVMAAFPIRVSAQGIRAYGETDYRSFLMPWSAISDTSEGSIQGGIRVVFVNSAAQQRSIYIPYVIARQTRFKELVSQWGGKQSALWKTIDNIS